MKKLILLAVLVLLSSCATNTSFNSFYQKHQSESDFSLGLNASLIRSFLDDDDIEDIKPLLKKAKHVRVLVFDENAENMSNKFDKFIKHSTFDKLVKVKEDNEKISLYTLEEKEKIKEVVVEVKSDGELILLGLKTNLTQEDIAKVMNDNSISLN